MTSSEIEIIHQQELPTGVFLKYDSELINKILDKTTYRDEEDSDEKRFLLCKTCNTVITSSEKRIDISGGHRHTFKNPAGIMYTIGCFSRARGCFTVGAPTDEFSWFPGFSWCFAMCAQCLSHMGWQYQSTGENFYGLILDNIVEGPEK